MIDGQIWENHRTLAVIAAVSSIFPERSDANCLTSTGAPASRVHSALGRLAKPAESLRSAIIMDTYDQWPFQEPTELEVLNHILYKAHVSGNISSKYGLAWYSNILKLPMI